MSAWSARIAGRFGSLNLDLELQGPGGCLALVGPNGAGKTSVLRALAGLLPGVVGRVAVGDRVWLDSERGIRLTAADRRVAYVPQDYALFPHLSVASNVAFALTGTRAERRERAHVALAELGIASLSGRSVRGLSGGERQRVALARALVRAPSLVLLDEPLAALDAAARRQARQHLCERLGDLGVPTVIVTHDARDARALGASWALLDHGRLVVSGSERDLLDQARGSTQSFVQELLGPTR